LPDTEREPATGSAEAHGASDPRGTQVISGPQHAKHLSLQESLEITTKLCLAAVTVIYVFGFIAFNAHLSKYGYIDRSIANPQFFVTGSLFLLFMGSWFLFAGRAIILGKKWMSNDLAIFAASNIRSPWPLLVFIESFLHLLFFIGMSVTSFGLLAYDTQAVQYIIGTIGTIGFFILYTIDIYHLDIKYPRLSLIAKMLFKIVWLVIFSISAAIDYRFGALFGVFFCICMYANIILDRFERSLPDRDLVIFTGLHGVVFALSTAVIFGHLFYGDIKAKIGGGEPQIAHIALNESVQLPGVQTEDNVISGSLLYSNDRDTLLLIGSAPVVIRTAGVKALKIEPRRNGDYVAELRSIAERFGLPPLGK
jgi:hypothetical protein